MNIIDLSGQIYEGMSVYPGDPGVTLMKLADFPSDECRVTELKMGSHTGTHVDTPAHFLPNGKSLTEMPLAQYVGEAVCVKASLRFDLSRPVIFLSSEERNRIRRQDRVIISTGWEKNAGSDAYFQDFPVFSNELLEDLISLEILLIGVDLPSVEDMTSAESAHKKLLSREIVIVEGLINLATLQETRFFLSAAPLRICGGDGSPVRAYAIS